MKGTKYCGLWLSNLIFLHYKFKIVFLLIASCACKTPVVQYNLHVLLFEEQRWCLLLCIQPPADALFAHPRLFRACVPPGMHQFRGNLWDYDCRPQIMQVLGYPLKMKDRIPEITKARNIELDLGLQVPLLFPLILLFIFPYQAITLTWCPRVME